MTDVVFYGISGLIMGVTFSVFFKNKSRFIHFTVGNGIGFALSHNLNNII